jgi:recombinational DNA repair protein (RecF pathway)
MQEYVTEAIVLHKEPVRDADARYSFLTKKFGKVVGKATSSRKITSKLAGHLEPGTVVTARFVERGGTQIVDALKSGKLAAAPTDLRLLSGLLAEGESDSSLWEEMAGGRFSWRTILALLGWDPRHAECDHCRKQATTFSVARQQFFCTLCASKLGRDGLILVDNGQV